MKTTTKGLQDHTNVKCRVSCEGTDKSEQNTIQGQNTAHQVMLASRDTVACQAPRGGHNLDLHDSHIKPRAPPNGITGCTQHTHNAGLFEELEPSLPAQSLSIDGVLATFHLHSSSHHLYITHHRA